MIIVAGQELIDRLDAEKAARVAQSACGFDSEQLCAIQREQAARGVLGVELVKAIHGWGARYDSGLQNFGLLRTSYDLGGSLEAAEAYARDWVSADPSRRYAWRRA